MAGTDQKSFLGTFSPWNTPRSSTPQPADHNNNSGSGSDVLQRSQGEDHTVTHRHKLGQRHYPSDCPPLKARWFYAVDSPKRKPSLNDAKKTDQKPLPPPKKFIPFSLKDSQSIESTFQNLIEDEDTRDHGHGQAPQEDEQQKQKRARASTKVAVNEDYLFDVDVAQRELSPAYWIGPVYEVRRGTWFFQDGSNLKPCEENLATQLEEGYLKLRPWRADAAEASSGDPATSAKHDRSSDRDRTDGSAESGTQTQYSEPSTSKSSRSQGTGKIPASSTMESRQYRLFGAYMNRIVAYQDSSTAWVTTDDFMSRVSTTVYQKLGGAPGNKVVRGLVEPKRSREPSDLRERDRDRKPVEKSSGARTPEVPSSTTFTETPIPQSSGTDGIEGQTEVDKPDIRRPQSTLERQMSSLAGEPQNPAELEEQARRQEEQEMEDLREVDGEDREREVDHIILVTHGIGQRLGLRLESINFIHDVNVLRKTLKTVYKASPDLQALNAAFADHDGNCRVQVLPVCWRHLLDFPYRGVRQNRKELDLTDADTVDDDAYPSLADITLESVPAVRNLISDLAMDVLLYQSGYCEHISNIVKQECNRIVGLYKQRNPSFNGTVSLCGHSLGSAILFDILCHQKTSESPKTKFTAPGDDLADQWKEEKSELSFECEEFFCLGSPIALFQMLKGKTIAGYSPLGTRKRKSALDIEFDAKAIRSLNSSKRDSQSHAGRGPIDNSAIISTPKCRDLYNIFHPSDPVSYRLEPLISPAMASLKPQPLPSVKKSIWTQSGQSLSIIGSRMGQSVGSLWSNFTSGVASSLLNRSLGLHADEVSSAVNAGANDRGHKRSQSGSNQDSSQGSDHPQTLIDGDLETLYDGFQKSRDGQKKGQNHAQSTSGSENDLDSEEQERKLKFEDAKVRGLNSNGRVDYSIQEGAFDISLIASIASHLTYWGDEDVNHFMLSQMLSRESRNRNKK
ncbi:hypothetical protein N7481_003502 [Penicillium waksmanii]|uniref:uncharacterized protein n=1 Tax=Penicillium waksmanii TaxID=69791 RepID=UPI0025495261|nr:uncharacterized protein N7481_003502 [Penicillium waksmanii]KAJ5988292.1 hypothetical protein N7481_003502 [Penicillium waksmanii]